MPTYRRPPIAEAVIDLRTEGSVDIDLLKKIENEFLTDYPFSQPNQHMNIELTENAATFNQSFQGYTMRSPDIADALVVSQGGISTTRMPPYEGWESLLERAKGNWTRWRRLVGKRKVTRIGVRFVNRLDIPTVEGEAFDLDEFLNVGVRIPPLGLSISSFAIHIEATSQTLEPKFLLNLGSVASPLVKTASFLVDIDTYLDKALPENDDGIWGLVNSVREAKNNLFESFITDKSRAIFNS